MMEFAVFFVIPFDENTPRGEGEETISRVRKMKEQVEEACLEAFHKRLPNETHRHEVWAQSRVDLEMRIVGVSLRLPIEKGADRNVVATVIHDDFLYWDYEELLKVMKAMHDAMEEVAAQHGVKVHTAFNEVKYRL